MTGFVLPIITEHSRILFSGVGKPLIAHAHPQFQVLVHMEGPPIGLVVQKTTVVIRERHAVLIRPWVAHCLSPDNPDSAKWASVLFEGSWLESNARNIPQGIRPCELFALSNDLHSGLVDIGRGSRDSPPAKALLHGVVQQLAMNAITCAHPSEHLVLDRRVRNALGRIGKPAEETTALTRMGSSVGLSKAQLYRRFNADLGCTPYQALASVRIGTAIGELLNAKPIQDIAHDLGFSAHAHFTRFFSTHLPVSPSTYRDKAIVLPHM